jgi:putative alpha-1,2-mannosidase
MIQKRTIFYLAAMIHVVINGFLFTASAQQRSKTVNYAAMVNTMIGTKGKGKSPQEMYLEAGFTFPGATYPFGMVQFTTTF